MQAGVLSGLIVETTATWDDASESFVLHTPSDKAAKNWISQVCVSYSGGDGGCGGGGGGGGGSGSGSGSDGGAFCGLAVILSESNGDGHGVTNSLILTPPPP